MSQPEADDVLDAEEVLADGVALIKPPNTLKDKVGECAEIDLGVIKRAETRLKAMEVEFTKWIGEDLDTLLTVRAAFKDAPSKTKLNAVFTAAHDLKGQGSTYNFPLVTQVAGSLCRYIETLKKREADTPMIIDAHVDAIQAIVNGNVTGTEDTTGETLASELSELVEAKIAEASQS